MPEKTHPLINDAALRLSIADSYLKKQLGVANGIEEKFNESKVRDWIQKGGTNEDEDSFYRGFYHFHDPTKDWAYASIWGLSFSSLNWAQDHTAGAIPDCVDLGPFGIECPAVIPNANPDRSWPGARKYFYDALTASDPTTREQIFANAFKYLGHVMHLLADAAVPEHSRNDQHWKFPNGSRYENWAEDSRLGYGKLSSLISRNSVMVEYADITIQSNEPGYIPISNFWDTTPTPAELNPIDNKLGLSEYTNVNFLSPGTMFKTYPYPANPQKDNPILTKEMITAEDGKIDYKLYFNGVTSDNRPIRHLASTKYLSSDLVQVPDMDSSKFILDEKCFDDYAAILVPKAVSYNAALLDYFFRGTMEISLPDDGVYAVAGPDSSFTKIRLKVKNTTANHEDMTNGTIQAVIHYRLALEDPLQSCPVTTLSDMIYEVSASVPLTSLANNTSQDITFDLSSSGVPSWATNVYAQVVFKGQLGNEEGAVAVGYKDISEPMPVDIINNMDTVCSNGKLYEAGSEAALKISSYGDLYKHGLRDVYVKFSPLDAPSSSKTASPTNYNAAFSSIPSGNYGRVFILTEPYYVNSLISIDAGYAKEDSRDLLIETGGPLTDFTHGLVNQTDISGTGTITYYALMTSSRGVTSFKSVTYQNAAYSSGTECDYNLSPTLLSGPVAVSVK